MPLLTLESSVGNNLRQNPMGFAVHLFPDTLRLGYNEHAVNTEKYVYYHKVQRIRGSDWNRRLECRRVGDIWGRECSSWLVSPLVLGRRADGLSSWFLLRVVHELQLAGHRFMFTVNEAR